MWSKDLQFKYNDTNYKLLVIDTENDNIKLKIKNKQNNKIEEIVVKEFKEDMSNYTSNKKYGKLNPDFDIPYYIFEEIVEYIEQTSKGRCRCMKWANIKALLLCAVQNNRISIEQAKCLEKTYCREKDLKDNFIEE